MKSLDELRRIEQVLIQNPPKNRKSRGRHEKNLREIRAMITVRENDAKKQAVKQEHGPLPAEAGRT